MPDRKIRGNSKDSGGISNGNWISYLQPTMIDAEKVKVNDSTESGWLKGHFTLIDLTETLIWILVTLAFFGMSIWFLTQSLRLDSEFQIIGIIMSCVTAYWVYQSVTVNKLVKVDTMLLKKDILPLMHEYWKKQGFEVEDETENVFVVRNPGPPAFLYDKHSTTVLFIISDCSVHYCLPGNGLNSRSPFLFTKWWLRRDLKSLLN